MCGTSVESFLQLPFQCFSFILKGRSRKKYDNNFKRDEMKKMNVRVKHMHAQQ